MFRTMSRTAAVAVVALMLVLASVPAAQASSFGTSGPSLDTRSGWFDVAISWLSGILFGEEASSPASTDSALEATGVIVPIGDGYTPLAGSCLDPAGSPRCNL